VGRAGRRDEARWPGGEALVVLDELHKWRGWKSWLKGELDQHRDSGLVDAPGRREPTSAS
jgi:hypothetical protein